MPNEEITPAEPTFTEAANEAIAEAHAEAEATDPTWGAGWESGGNTEDAPAVQGPTHLGEERVAEVFEEHGYDLDELSEFVAETPEARALFEAPAGSEADIVRAAALAANLKAQQDATEAYREHALEQAIDAYDEGEADPVEIADALEATFGLETAAEFVRHWHADEAEEPEEDYGPATAEEWASLRVQQHQNLQTLQQAAAEATAQQAAEANLEAVRQTLQSTFGELQARPDFERLAPTMADINSRVAPDALPQTPEEAQAFAHRSYRAARELATATEAAEIQARMEHRALLRQESSGWGTMPTQHELAARVARRTAEVASERLNPNALLPGPTPQEQAAEIARPFIERATSNDEWGSWMGKALDGAESLEAAHRVARQASRDAVLGWETPAERRSAWTSQIDFKD